MHTLTAMLAAEHLHERLSEAEASRRSRGRELAGPMGPAAWRRALGRGARVMNIVFERIATRLDPEDRRSNPVAA